MFSLPDSLQSSRMLCHTQDTQFPLPFHKMNTDSPPGQKYKIFGDRVGTSLTSREFWTNHVRNEEVLLKSQ